MASYFSYDSETNFAVDVSFAIGWARHLWGDLYPGIRLQALFPEQTAGLLETVEVLHDWIAATYGVGIFEYLAEDRRPQNQGRGRPPFIKLLVKRAPGS